MKGRLLGIVGDSLISFWDTIDRIPEEPDLDTVILPIGSVEQHSHHLPVGMDLIIASAVAEAVARRIHRYLLSALPISTCYGHKGKKAACGCLRRFLWNAAGYHRWSEEPGISQGDFDNQARRRFDCRSGHSRAECDI